MENRQFVENISQLVNKIPRTKFNMTGTNCGLKLTTMNKGLLYPIFCEEVLPGDTWKVSISALIRATTMIKPIMNNMWAQIQCFFVPNRLTYKHWEEVMGENKQGPFITNKTEYEVPYVSAPAGGWDEKSLAEHLGVPSKIEGLKINALYTRGYAKICNDWFRDENRMNFTHIKDDETPTAGTNGNNYVTDIETGGCLYPVAKAHDIFTSSSIEPQKGPNVLLPLGTSAPVYTNNDLLEFLKVQGNGNAIELTAEPSASGATIQATGQAPYNESTLKLNANMNGKLYFSEEYETGLRNKVDEDIDIEGVISNGTKIGVTNLKNATAANINDLRLAIALQQMYELDAIGGTRYTEILYSHFGVKSSDARLQRSEYLGGKKVPITVTQVIQNSETASTPQGNLTGMSQTFDGEEYFTKSFEEHGILYVMCCIKGEEVYQQGLPAKFSKFKRTDYYDPIFANIGMQPIYNREIYAQGNSKIEENKVVDEQAFGYKNAWDEYRYLDKQVAGEFRSNATKTIDYWHIARDFKELPTNGEDFIMEGAENLDRTLTVSSQEADQFQAAFALNAEVVRCVPAFGVPGLKRF